MLETSLIKLNAGLKRRDYAPVEPGQLRPDEPSCESASAGGSAPAVYGYYQKQGIGQGYKYNLARMQ